MSLQTKNEQVMNNFGIKNKIGLIFGPVLFLIIIFVPINAIDAIQQRCLAVALWMAVWWITEPVPIAATSIMPLVLFPLLGITDASNAASPYANKNVMLFLGGFMLAQGIVKWNLHQRLSLLIIKAIGTSPRKIIFGFMAATAILSMWISNTAAAVALLPIGLAVSTLVSKEIEKQKLDIPTDTGKFKFGIALMLGIAFAATIGGLGTPIGSPPNLIFIGALEEMFPEISVSFFQWITFGIPMVIILIPVAWAILCFVFKPGFKEIPGGNKLVTDEYKKLGSWTRAEKSVMAIFSFTALLWIVRTSLINKILPMVDDSTIAILGALLLFIVPISWEKGHFALDWQSAVKIPWGVLLLFGGGLSLASAISNTGLAAWLSSLLGVFSGLPVLLIVFIIALFTSLLSEVTSNTAVAAMTMPVMVALSAGTGQSPIALMLSAAISASFVFLLPVGTPPNAAVYGSGYLRIIDMIKGGILIKLTSILIGTLLIYYLALPVFLGGN
ncbi:MAG: SLC13/DASS family transporter [Dehalococcoidales bacterium]|nr:MAG: SLC13/DASS family transporter [Dehalococcoidales bacterium]